MKFDDLQIVWNTQHEAPLFAIDQVAMHRLIRHKNEHIRRYVEWSELAVIAGTLLVAVALPIDAWGEGDGWHAYAVSLVCLLVGLSTLFARARRRGNQINFDRSIKAIAEQGIARLDRHIRSLRLYFWCLVVPVALLAAIGLTMYSNTRPVYIVCGVALVTAATYAATQLEIHKKLLPQRRELESVVVKLREAE